MLEVTIPVHPLSRAIIVSEYGVDPVLIEPHDLLFELINTRITTDNLRAQPTLSTNISLVVNDRRAAHLAQYGFIAGARLLKFHHHMLCRFVDAQTRVRGSSAIKDAIIDFLQLYGVDEDAYSFESAAKLYQRFFLRHRKKNADFVAQLRRKSSAQSRNIVSRPIAIPDFSSLPAEGIVSKFMAEVHFLMNRYHKRLADQARAYIYVRQFCLPTQLVAQKLGIPHRTVQHRVSAMRRRLIHNPTYARLLAQAADLPPAQ